MNEDLSQTLEQVTAKTKLERDKGIRALTERLPSLPDDDVGELETFFSQLNTLSAESSQHSSNAEGAPAPSGTWEKLLGVINGAAALTRSGRCSQEFAEELIEPAMATLTHGEVRVREGVGQLLGAITARIGILVYERVGDRLLRMILNNLERDQVSASVSLSRAESEDEGDDVSISEAERNRILIEKMSQGQPERKRSYSASEIFHDTAGWKNLETSMKCLEQIIDHCRSSFGPYVKKDLTDLVTESLYHTNRFVRETGYNLLGALVRCVESEEVLLTHGETFAKHLSLGLADNWSQVRLSASTASRNFLLSLEAEKRNPFYPSLLPCICLNRYYVAEGVKLYNQQTWKNVIADAGIPGVELVTSHIQSFVDFYIAQTRADNHAVREAACACIAELGLKLPPDCVRGHVTLLLAALIDCFRDDSWPVRDAACIACGNFIKSFPAETASSLEELFPLFFLNLSDNIPSVRHGAASALASVVSAHPDVALPVCLAKIESGWKEVPKQEAKEEKNATYEKSAGVYGIVKRVRDDGANGIDDAHSNQVMYSCGSLAPKMGRGGGTRSGGCMDHQFTRPSELWEIGDGCLHLAAEIVLVSKDGASKVSSLFPLLVTALKHHDYPQHVVFHESFCKRLPDLAKGLGKQVFKRHLESFFSPLFYSLDSEVTLTSAAASKAIADIASFIGPGIFKGRVENYDSSLMIKLPPLPQTLMR